MIETMNDEQLKGYLENHPAGGLKMIKDQKMKNKVRLRFSFMLF